jgi:hypothetical protein
MGRKFFQASLPALARAAALLTAASLAAPATAGRLIWEADPAKGKDNFKNVEISDGTSFSVIDDPAMGKVFRFSRDRTGANRCEAKGALGYDTKEGDTVYVHVRYKLVAPSNITLTGIMQWKTYDTPGHPNDLNYPLLLRPVSGRLTLEAYKPRTDLWSIPTPIDTWFEVVIGIYQSYDQGKGWVEFWYNGQPVAFKDGATRFACKTLAGGDVNPKWGIYGTNSSAKPISASYIRDLRIATDYITAATGGAYSGIRPVTPRRRYLGGEEAARFFDLIGRAAQDDRPAAGACFLRRGTPRPER